MNRSILESSYRKPVITKETLKSIRRHPEFYTESPVRTQIGKIYTNKEFAQKSDDVLSRKLPGEEKKLILRKVFKSKK